MRVVEIRKLLFNISAMAVDSSTQRISRLTPLDAVLACIDTRVEPVTPRDAPLDLVLTEREVIDFRDG